MQINTLYCVLSEPIFFLHGGFCYRQFIVQVFYSVSNYNCLTLKNSGLKYIKLLDHVLLLSFVLLFPFFFVLTHTYKRSCRMTRLIHIEYICILTFLSINLSHLNKSHIITDSNTNFTNISIKDCQLTPSRQSLGLFETYPTWDVNIK